MTADPHIVYVVATRIALVLECSCGWRFEADERHLIDTLAFVVRKHRYTPTLA